MNNNLPLSDLLLSISEDIKKEKQSPLEQNISKHLRKFLEHHRKHFFTYNSEIERFMGFYLYLLIEHLLYVLSGDIRYEEKSKIERDKILFYFVDYLTHYISILNNPNNIGEIHSKFFSINLSFTNNYFDGLKKLNLLLSDGE